MVRLAPDLFLTELGRLYEDHRTTKSGAVWLTFKRNYPSMGAIRGKRRREQLHCSDQGRPDSEPVCLVRATNSKKKLSVEVRPSDAAVFSNAIMSIVRLNADILASTPPQGEAITADTPEIKRNLPESDGKRKKRQVKK